MAQKKIKKVLSIVPRGLSGYGGIETFCLELDSRVVKNCTHYIQIKFCETRGKESILVWPILFLPKLFKIIYLLFFGKIDVVHLNVSWGVSNYRKIFIVLFARLARVPIITHSHAGGLDRVIIENFIWLKIFGLILKLSSKVVVLGNMWIDLLNKRFIIPKEKIKVIRNGVFDANPLGQISANGVIKNIPQICFIGMVGPHKGADILISALRYLNMRGVNFHCIFAGNGDLAHYKRLTEDAGLTGLVEFLGWVDKSEVYDILQSSSIFVLPSQYENLPMSVIEAMSFGCAVVTTSAGVISEFITDHLNGLIVEPNAESVSKAIQLLLDEPSLCFSLGRNARDTYLDKFVPEKTLDELIKLFIETASF